MAMMVIGRPTANRFTTSVAPDADRSATTSASKRSVTSTMAGSMARMRSGRKAGFTNLR